MTKPPIIEGPPIQIDRERRGKSGQHEIASKLGFGSGRERDRDGLRRARPLRCPTGSGGDEFGFDAQSADLDPRLDQVLGVV